MNWIGLFLMDPRDIDQTFPDEAYKFDWTFFRETYMKQSTFPTHHTVPKTTTWSPCLWHWELHPGV